MIGAINIMRYAAVMLILNSEGLILGVSRRYDTTKFGLPGGKLEPSETAEEAGIRETFEETGIKVKSCVPLYKRLEPAHDPNTGFPFYTLCFYATEWEGTPVDSDEGVVKWLKSEDLTGDTGAFSEYNRNTLNKFKEMFPEVKVQ